MGGSWEARDGIEDFEVALVQGVDAEGDGPNESLANEPKSVLAAVDAVHPADEYAAHEEAENADSGVQTAAGLTSRGMTQTWERDGSDAGDGVKAGLGDLNFGAASGFTSTIPLLPTVFFGSFSGGSRVGADIANPPPGFSMPFPPFASHPMPVWQYNITLSDPGIFSIIWVSPASAPNVRVYATVGSFNFTEAQTTYVGATITVTPTPSTITIIASCGVLARRGRRVSLSGGQH